MTDKAKKISELTAATSVAANDLFVIVGNTSGTSTTKKITMSNLFANVDSNTTFKQVVNVGANVSVNTTALKIGNSTVYATVNSTVISLSNSIVTNTTSITVGTDVSVNTTAIKIGNSTVNTVVNSSVFYVGANVVIKANTYAWTFHDSDGLLYLPNGSGNSSGFIFPENPAGGSGDEAHILYEPLSGENMVLELRVHNDNDDLISLDSSGTVKIITNGATAPNTWIFQANGQLTAPGTISSNFLSVGKVEETFSSITGANGAVTHDCTSNHIFNHSSVANNFTANFTNLNLANNKATALTLVINQGATAYVANAVQVGGASQTVNWQGNTSPPTGNANKKDIMTFSILNSSGTYTVFGQLTSFG